MIPASIRALFLLALLPAAASAQIWSEGFEGGSNEGDWEAWWSNYNTVEASGGNPGGYFRLHTTGNLACHKVEIWPNTWPAGFTGDWRAAGVNTVGIDVDIVEGRYGGEWTLRLANDMGTSDTADDCFAVYTPPETPPDAPGWTSFDFDVPAASPTMPMGWTSEGPCSGSMTPDDIWNLVIQDVSYFRFLMDSDPNTFCLFTFWDLGIDNIRVESGTTGSPFCFGDGTGTACPCGNEGGAGEGCENSTGDGGLLTASGGPSVSSDTLAFDATNLVPNQPGLLFAGELTINNGDGVPFGDGLRCAGMNVVRLGTMTPDGMGAASWGPGLSGQGGWAPGDTRHFQVWYRDPSSGPCGQTFNLTNGVTVTFTN